MLIHPSLGESCSSLGLCVLMTPLYWELQEKGQESLNHAGKISYTSDIHPDSLKASKVSKGHHRHPGRDTLPGKGEYMVLKGLLLFASTENKASKKGCACREALNLVPSALV